VWSSGGGVVGAVLLGDRVGVLAAIGPDGEEFHEHAEEGEDATRKLVWS
jgi:hypothetical protein